MAKNKAEHQAILIIAGSDSGGGAGIQADIKTATALKTFATTAITCITAQNTVGVKAVLPLGLDIIKKQIEAVLDDFPIRVIKTGMLFSAEIIDLVISILQERDFYNIRQEKILLLVDPVMV
jgi:hydroxymethylpyrimidine/phosphomethylpyrimidine kinase